MADIFRRRGEAYAAAHVLTPAQGRVLGALRACRNRHCPGCQALAQREWLEKRLERVL